MIILDKKVLRFLSVLLLFGVVFNVEAANRAEIVMQMVPEEVEAGQEFTAIFQFKNIGNTTWQSDTGFALRSLFPKTWQVHTWRLDHKDRIKPGQTLTIKPKLVAPSKAGKYSFQWQMSSDGTRFGPATSKVKINVKNGFQPLNDAEFVYQDVPADMTAGATYTAMVQFKNTGNVVWTPGQFALWGRDTLGLTWAVDKVEMKENAIVRPGEFLTFRFDVKAPDEAGRYPFLWQMYREDTGVFGEASKLLRIDVKPIQSSRVMEH